MFWRTCPSFKPPQTIPLQHVVLWAAVVEGRKELEALNPSTEDKSDRYPVHKVLEGWRKPLSVVKKSLLHK